MGEYSCIWVYMISVGAQIHTSCRGRSCPDVHMPAHGGDLRACEAYGRAVVEEVRGATEGKHIVSGLFPEEFEEVDRLAGIGCGVGAASETLRGFGLRWT